MSVVLRLEIVMSFFFSELREILIPALLRLESGNGKQDRVAGTNDLRSHGSENAGAGSFGCGVSSDWSCSRIVLQAGLPASGSRPPCFYGYSFRRRRQACIPVEKESEEGEGDEVEQLGFVGCGDGHRSGARGN
jgi:hypothetical protein